MHLRSRSTGFTLVELMVALTLGMIVIGAVLGVFFNAYQSNTENLKVTRMNEEMRTAMSIMTHDIRRAGAWQSATQTVNFGTPNSYATNLNWSIGRFDGTEPLNSCVLFAYDSDGANNAVDFGDRFGYRLVDGALERRKPTTLVPAPGCTLAGNANWDPITDERGFAVTNLTFTTTLESGAPGVGLRTVIVTLEGAVNTRASNPTTSNGSTLLTSANCAGNTLAINCRQLVEKIRMRNDAVL